MTTLTPQGSDNQLVDMPAIGTVLAIDLEETCNVFAVQREVLSLAQFTYQKQIEDPTVWGKGPIFQSLLGLFDVERDIIIEYRVKLVRTGNKDYHVQMQIKRLEEEQRVVEQKMEKVIGKMSMMGWLSQKLGARVKEMMEMRQEYLESERQDEHENQNKNASADGNGDGNGNEQR